MEDKFSPRVVLNDEYIDLRKRPTSTKAEPVERGHVYRRHKTFCSSDLENDRLQYEKDNDPCRIKGGLKKLATFYNASANTYKNPNITPIKKSHKRGNIDPRFHRYNNPDEKSLLSLSDGSITPQKMTVDSNSHIRHLLERKSFNVEMRGTKIVEPLKNKYTMTATDNSDGCIKPRKIEAQSRPRDYYTEYTFFNYLEILIESHAQSRSNLLPGDFETSVLDPRLCEKYSVLKMPWKRTWTFPAFSPKSNYMCDRSGGDNFDRQTYLYDDGTEIDSTFIEGKHPKIIGRALQNQCMTLLLFGGSVCGVLLVSLLIWFIFGNNFFHIFFKPREAQDRSLKDYVKFIGGGIIYIVASLFKTIGRVLTIPTQQVYQSQPEHYRWQANDQLQMN